MKKIKLPVGYTITEISEEQFFAFFRKSRAKVFKNEINFMPWLFMNKKEQKTHQKLNAIYQKRIKIFLGVFYKGKMVGWFSGDQQSADTFHMRNSAILKAHRCKGLYSCLLVEVLKRTKDLGFEKVTSRHLMTNNAIIIPKLKAGFKMTNVELSDNWGTLVHLSYYHNKLREKVLSFRSGQLSPDKKLKKILAI
jgi:hypothetical protein